MRETQIKQKRKKRGRKKAICSKTSQKNKTGKITDRPIESFTMLVFLLYEFTV
jgi:hypothetical protein